MFVTKNKLIIILPNFQKLSPREISILDFYIRQKTLKGAIIKISYYQNAIGKHYKIPTRTAFLGKYQGKGVILVVVFLLSEKVINRTHRSEPFLSVHTMQLASDQKPEAAQD